MPVYLDKKRKTYTVRVRVNDGGKSRQTTKRGFPTAREAKKWEREYVIEMEAHTAVPVKTYPTFIECAQKYLDSIDTSEDTKKQKMAKYRKYFAMYLDTPVDQITKENMVDWRKYLGEQDLATQTKNMTLQYVRSVFKFASDTYDIPNVSSQIRNFKKTQEEINKEMKTWSIQEFSTFLSHVDMPLYRLYFEFVFWTGTRRGEALAVTKDDIKDGTVTISKSIKHFQNGSKSTKNKKVRTIALDPVLLADLQPLMEVPGPYLFGGDRTLPITNVQRELTKGIKASGVKPIRLHDFRHSHVSILLDHGVSTVAVANRIGDTIAMVEKTYAHMMQNTETFMNQTICSLHTSEK